MKKLRFIHRMCDYFEWSMDELSLLNTAVLGLAMHGPAAAPVFHGFLV